MHQKRPKDVFLIATFVWLDKNHQQLQKALKELISLLNNKMINPVAANEFSWDQISKAHFGMENAQFTGKTYVNILD